MTRDELVRAACRGDVQARNELGPWIQDELFEFFANRFADRETIAELIQLTMVDVWTKAAQEDFPDAGAFVARVLSFGGMTARAVRTQIKREAARRARLALVVPPEPSRSLSSTIADREAWRLLERCLGKLPTPQRDIARHRLTGGRYREFAEARGITVKAAQRRHEEAVRRLKVLFDQERVSPPPR